MTSRDCISHYSTRQEGLEGDFILVPSISGTHTLTRTVSQLPLVLLSFRALIDKWGDIMHTQNPRLLLAAGFLVWAHQDPVIQKAGGRKKLNGGLRQIVFSFLTLGLLV